MEDALPPDHMARFVVEVIAELDLSSCYEHYGKRGGPAYAPEILLGLMFYGYATGVFSSRKIHYRTLSARGMSKATGMGRCSFRKCSSRRKPS